MRPGWQPMWLVVLGVLGVLGAGCSSRPAAMGLGGEVSYEGRAVEKGRIDFEPVDNTAGPSAGATIAHGRYDVPAKWGLLPDGVYLVRITAFRKTGKTEPNRIDPRGPRVEVEENFIPAVYNNQSTLKVRVSDLPSKDKVDFRLP